jgi:hypothetical protein
MKTAKARASKKPAIDGILAAGICVFEKRGKKKFVRVLNNEKEAVHYGIPKAQAAQMFAGWFGPSNCVLNFGWFGGVSCDGSDDCPAGKTCKLQYWDNKVNDWQDFGGSSSAIASQFIWRCKCR